MAQHGRRSLRLVRETFRTPEVAALLVEIQRAVERLQAGGSTVDRADFKDILTVLDVTGRQHPNFRFDRHLRELLGHTPRELREFLERSFGRLLSGCVLQFEEHAKRDILARVKHATP